MSLNKRHTVSPTIDKGQTEKQPKRTIFGIFMLYVMVFFAVICSFHAFSQSSVIQYPSVNVINEDTLIMFKIEQAKQLSVWNEERKECLELNNVINQEMIQKDIIISAQRREIDNYKQIVIDNDIIVKQTNDLLSICNLEKTSLQKEVKRQRRQKIGAITGGVLGIAIMTTLLIIK